MDVGKVVYAIWYRNPDGAWKLHQTFETALDADRAFQALERVRPRHGARLVRMVVTTVLGDIQPRE